MKKLAFIISAFLLLVAPSAPAQSNVSGLHNVVSQKSLSWKKVSSEHFDIYYHSPDPTMATLSAKIAEESLWDVCSLFDYKNRGRFALYLFSAQSDYIQSNLYPVPQYREGGLTPINNNTTSIVFPGSYRELAGKIKSETARMVIEDYYFGGGIQASIQNTVLLHLPSWYIEGLTSYIGEGWSYEDERAISNLENTDMLSFALEGDDYISHVARKSIWHFIFDQYSVEKTTEIFYMVRLTRSVEDGVIHVFGITLKTLTEKWREYTVNKITQNNTFRDNIKETAQRIDVPDKMSVTGFDVSPANGDVALMLLHNGINTLNIYHPNDKSFKDTKLKGGFKTEQFEAGGYEVPVAFSKEGNKIITVIYANGEEQLALYDVLSGEIKYSRTRPQVDRVNEMEWSYDNSQIVCTGQKDGIIDLFIIDPENLTFEQITNDQYDEKSPVWSRDDQRIYYSSNRSNENINPEKVRFDIYRNNFDIYEFSLSSSEIRQITITPLHDEYPVFSSSGFEMDYLTDATGLFNLNRKNVFTGDSAVITNIAGGMEGISLSDSFAVVSSPDFGGYSLYMIHPSDLLKSPVAMNTELRLKNDKAWKVLQDKEIEVAKTDSIEKVKEEDKEKAENNEEKSESKVKYYVFDEEDNSSRPTKKKNYSNYKKAKKEKPVKPDFNETEVDNSGYTENNWTTSNIRTRLGFDPVFKFNIELGATLKDQKGDRYLSASYKPFQNFKNYDFSLSYMNQKSRLDKGISIERFSRYINRPELGFTSRYNSTRILANVIYPVNRYLSINAGIHSAYVDRAGLFSVVPKEIDGNEIMTGGRLGLYYDKTIKSMDYTLSGTKGFIELSNSYSVLGSQYNFTTLQFDIRKYVPVKRMVLATRFGGAWSEGSNGQMFFIGGVDNSILSKFTNAPDLPMEGEISKFNYMQYVGPIHGFQFNARNGSKYIIANAELRIPVSRSLRNSLNNNPLFNWEFIPFFDFGTAWNTGNPLSQKNPINTDQVGTYPVVITVQTLKSPFVMGFGAGTRMNLFGYSVRFDVGMGVEDYAVLSPKMHLSLGKNF